MFGRANYEVPTLRNYAAAANHYNNVKPIRGRLDDCRPAGRRRKTELTIRKQHDAESNMDKYAVRLYATDVLTYRANRTHGTIEVRLGNWPSQSTVQLLNEALPLRFNIYDSRVWVHCRKQGSAKEGYYAVHNEEVNIFEDHEFVNPASTLKHRINRQRANEIRKNFKGFKDYLRTTMKVRDEGFSVDEFKAVFGQPRVPSPLTLEQKWMYYDTLEKSVAEFLELTQSPKIEDLYRATLWLVTSPDYGKAPYNEEQKAHALKSYYARLDELILFAHRQECFDREVVCDGNAVRDSYAKFFRWDK